MPKLDERELTAILAAEKRDALSADQAARLSEEREKAMDYYNGDMKADMPAQPDRSRAVSSDVLDTVEGLMPGLMEIFCGGDEVVRFNAVSEEDEEQAQQETDYINHVFMQINDGFGITYSFVKDALLSKNGVVKIYWEEKEDEDRQTYFDQTEDVYTLFLNDPEVEVIEHSEHEPEIPEVPAMPQIGLAPAVDIGAGLPVEPAPGLNGGPGGAPPGISPGPPSLPSDLIGGMPGPGPEMQNPMPMGPAGQDSAPPLGPGGSDATMVPPGPPPLPVYGPLHDFTTVRKRTYGCCKVEPVPPEEFGVSRRARLGQPLDYSYHQVQRTVAELIAQGFDEDQLEDLPDSPPDENSESIARNTVEDDKTYSSSVNRATRLITVTEHYATLDYEGDGKAGLYRVTTAGGEDGQILKRNGKIDIVRVNHDPFASMTPIIVTHRFFGKSIADLVMDIQRIKTALYRGMLDNVYLANNQRLEISESHSGPNTIDDLLNNRPGGLVRTKQPGGLVPIPNQNLGEYVYPALEYMDSTREWRTGVVRQGQGIDADALQNQSATAVQKVYSAAQAKMKLVARVMAETGFKQLFWKIHATVRANERNTQTVRLTRKKWITVNPAQWQRRDDLTVSVGLGSGGKAEQAAFWNSVLMIQKEAIMMPGQNIVSPKNIHNALGRYLEAGGEKSIDEFFSDPEDPANPPGEAPPDPKMIEMQGKAELQKMQFQADQQKMMGEAQLKQAEMRARIEMEKVQMQADIAANDRKVQADIALAREKFQMDSQLEIQRFNLEQQKMQAELEGKTIDRRMASEEKAFERQSVNAERETTRKNASDGDSAKWAEVLKAIHAPKRVIRDPKTNRVVGVESVMNGAG
jgi:hypothetical protein